MLARMGGVVVGASVSRVDGLLQLAVRFVGVALQVHLDVGHLATKSVSKVVVINGSQRGIVTRKGAGD
jgi:hypothetical protein